MALFLLPTGAVLGASEIEGTSTAIEQHTAYVELIAQEDEDVPGFAAVAGVVSCQGVGLIDNAVLWFNDQVFFREGRRGPQTGCLSEAGNTHVWATQEGAPDPRGNPSLEPTGDTFEFTDPNGVSWLVEEYIYHTVHVFREEGTSVTVGDLSAGVTAEGEVRFLPHHAWVVEMGPAVMDPTIQSYYNFVTIVDFDHLDERDDATVHDGQEAEPKEGESHNATDPDEQHRLPHTHDEVTLHLWVGPAPEEGPGEGYEQGVRAEPKVLLPDNVL